MGVCFGNSKTFSLCQEAPGENNRPQRESLRTESATLAADPFEFQSESAGNSPLPLNCIGEINFSQLDQSKQSLSPLLDILRLRLPESQSHSSVLDDSSSSDSESFSQKSIGRYTLPRSLNHVGGPGPATFGSMNQLLTLNSPHLKPNSAIEGHRESLMSESVTSFDENDEECWRIPSLAQIDTLASARKPLGPNRLQYISKEQMSDSSSPTFKRSSTIESSVSSLTGPSMWTGNDEFEHTPSQRASLLQAPLDVPPPKPSREPRKPSLGVQSLSPSLRRGHQATPPLESTKTTPESTKFSTNFLFEMPTSESPKFNSKSYSSPSAPLPRKPDARSPSCGSQTASPLQYFPTIHESPSENVKERTSLLDEVSSTLNTSIGSVIIQERNPSPIMELSEDKEEDYENKFIESNYHPSMATPPQSNSANKSRFQEKHSKKSTELQLDRPKLRPQKREPPCKKPQMKAKDSPNHRTPTKTPQSKPKETFTKPVEPKLTFQQRMESWLHHSDHSPEAPNPFLEVLKER